MKGFIVAAFQQLRKLLTKLLEWMIASTGNCGNMRNIAASGITGSRAMSCFEIKTDITNGNMLCCVCHCNNEI